MPALASPSTWRTSPHKQEHFLIVYNPEAVFSCSVNQSSFTYPVAVLTYDTVTLGAYTDVQLDALVRVRSSAGVFKGWGRIRLDPTSSLLYIGHVSNGEIDFANNDLIDVYDDYRPFAKIPRTLSNGTVYKDYDLAYTDQGTHIPPKCNAGGPVVEFIGVDDLIHVDFDLTDSYPVGSGATLGATPYTGDLVDGSVDSGTIASGIFTASFPAGKRQCVFNVTDSNSEVGAIHVPVVALNGRTDANIVPCTITSHRIDVRSGASIEFTVEKADLSKTAITQGALVILFTVEAYGNTEGSLVGPVGRENICFVGWVTENKVGVSPDYSDVPFTAVDITGQLDTLPAFPVTLFHKASPSKWEHVKDLSLFRYLYYLLYWHSNVLSICDLPMPSWDAVYTETPNRLDADAGHMLTQMQTGMGYIDGLFLADKNGRVCLNRNPQFMSDADRSGVATTITLQTSDYSNISWTERHKLFVYWLRGSGVIADNASITPKLAISPGTSPSQGNSESTLDRQLILDQADLNVRTGRKYTFENNEIPDLSLDLYRAGRIIDLANAEFIALNLPATLNRRQTVFSNSLFIPKEIDISYGEWGITSESIVMEPVVYGVAATKQDVPVDKAYDINYSFPTIDTYDYTPPSDLPLVTPSQAFITLANSPFIYAWTSNKLGRLRKGTTNWELVATAAEMYPGAGSPKIQAFRLHPWDPKNKAVVFMTDESPNPGYEPVLVQISNLNSTSPAFATILTTLQIATLGGNLVPPAASLADCINQIDLSININGYFAVSLISASRGDVIYRKSDSDSWYKSNIAAMADGGCTIAMGHHVPSAVSGRLYAISSQIPGGTFETAIYVSTDNGASWAQDYNFHRIRAGYANLPIDMPYDGNLSDLRLYAALGIPGYDNSIVRRNTDNTYTAIAPSSGGYWGAAFLLSHTYDHNQVVITGLAPSLVAADNRLMYTLDAGSNWTTIDNATAAGMPVWIGGWPYDNEVLFAISADATAKLLVTSNLISGSPSSVVWDDITYDFHTVVDAVNNPIGMVPVWVS